jgi:hypothetical protein
MEKKNMTIIMTHFENDYYDVDYRKKYNEYENDVRVQIYYDDNDLMDLINIATNQIKRCNRIIIER